MLCQLIRRNVQHKRSSFTSTCSVHILRRFGPKTISDLLTTLGATTAVGANFMQYE